MIDRKPYDEDVSHPGKFQGEPAYVPFYWEMTLEGFASEELDDNGQLWSIFFPSDEDRAIFPEIGDAYAIALWEDDFGFVNRSEFSTQAEYEKIKAAIEAESPSNED
jgi:hypothetical protein